MRVAFFRSANHPYKSDRIINLLIAVAVTEEEEQQQMCYSSQRRLLPSWLQKTKNQTESHTSWNMEVNNFEKDF